MKIITEETDFNINIDLNTFSHIEKSGYRWLMNYLDINLEFNLMVPKDIGSNISDVIKNRANLDKAISLSDKRLKQII